MGTPLCSPCISTTRRTPPTGPEHLLFTLPDDIFVLPQALQIVQDPPPAVTAVTPNADGTVTVTGTGLNAGSSVFFDSLPGQVTVPYARPADSNSQSGSFTVMPPPGASGQTATITVYNTDGQNPSLSAQARLRSPIPIRKAVRPPPPSRSPLCRRACRPWWMSPLPPCNL